MKTKLSAKIKKSQSALEFLTTYSWAFILILIIIAAFSYFGILKPQKILPERCSISPEISCLNYIIGQTDSGTGVLRLKLRSNFPKTIVVNSWNTTSDNAQFSCAQKPIAGTWQSGEVKDIEFTNCNNKDVGLILGDKGKIGVKMNYYLAGLDISYSKELEGEVFSTVTKVESLLTQGQNCSDGIDNDNNGCFDYSGGDTGCSATTDTTESGGTCPQNGGSGQPLFCYASTFCGSDTLVFRMSDFKDAHAEIPSLSNYDYTVCCKSATDTLSNSCASPDSIPLHLNDTTDAHVEKSTVSNYNFKVCLSANAGNVVCTYTTNPSCNADETCLATLQWYEPDPPNPLFFDTDAHVGDCVTQPFINKICCKIA